MYTYINFCAVNLDVKDYGDIDFGLPKRSPSTISHVPIVSQDGKIMLKNLDEVAGANKQV